MKIAVIAANGRTGKIFVEAALNSGHIVNAGVHSHNPFEARENLEVITCDATNLQDVTKLIQGCDAVVSLIGHGRRSKPSVQTDAIRTICKAVKSCGITRLISLTGTGVRFEGDIITITDKILNFSISHIDPLRIADGIAHMEVIKDSELDWTMIRVLKLQNTAYKPFSLREHGPTKSYVSRHEVAEAILQVLTDKSFIQKAPIISKS